MALAPTANQISVREVLDKFEAEFAPVAQAVENGEFALWVGSGISRQAPSLGMLIERAFDYLRERANDPASAADFTPALEEALALAEIDSAAVRPQYAQPLATWPEHDAIIDRLWTKYSRVLDIRVPGRDADFILWEAVDIRTAFERPAPPAAEHLSIAVLILEGSVQEVASANWDGFIEAAVARLSGGVPGVMQVVVDPNQLRAPAGRAKLLKFHGCIMHATHEPLTFRQYLTGSYTQIMDWPETAAFAAMRNEIVGLATNHKTLVLGLSIQDNNLQTIFTRAKAVHGWPWPCTPAAPAHIFCEDSIQLGQRDVLRLVYGDAYNNAPAALHDATLLRAWGEQVLIALVLRLLCDKLSRLMDLSLTASGQQPVAAALAPALKALRDELADHAIVPPGERSRTAFANQAIGLWSRMLSLFRRGALPVDPGGYETLSSSTPNLLAADQNALAMGLGTLGVILALLQQGRAAGHWELTPPVDDALSAGAMSARPNRPGASGRPVFLVKSAADAIALQSNGAFANDNAIVVHADDIWRRMVGSGGSARRVRSAPGRTGRVGNTHVSVADLLGRSTDAVGLQSAFVAEMML
ncbi:SIR2 family protein [Mesorhizobium sp. CO1-1-4]|uniref:SIR2 family protein n=1 Tax=Mesorhizobium sp. CO1-1-4 TaxID=2876633 RepID=UPI001CCFEF07|nr:SIR2 family protein [Mesorhizobium sp. CO1-1-4]MBZ9738373.1 SIR2 family protein [Mesorhizobium sp. CO1-1-4]